MAERVVDRIGACVPKRREKTRAGEKAAGSVGVAACGATSALREGGKQAE